MPEESQHAGQQGPWRRALVLILQLLLAVAFGIASYLAWTSVRGGTPIGCGPESGCDQVLHSRWAYWWGIPVSLLSLVIYGAMLAATVGLDASRPQQRKSGLVLFCGAILLLGATVWFTGLQMFVIKRFCPFCLVAHLCGLTAAALVFFVQRVGAGEESPRQGKETHLTYRAAKNGCVAALLGLALLVIGQVAHRPPTFVVKSIPSDGPATPAPATPLRVQSPVSVTATPPAGQIPGPQTELKPATAPQPHRTFPIYSGRFAVDLDAVPVIGAPSNAQVVVSLFDYTCHHCRLMHPRLIEAQRVFSHQLVIASLPMPLHPQCNQTIKGIHPDHTNACEYARLGLAVWRADRRKHRAFDDWLFAAAKPPPAAEAQDYARQLVGESALSGAHQDPWVEEQLKLNVLIYELAYRAGQGSMPQLIVGSNVAVGTFPQQELLQLLEKNLGLTKAPF